MTKNMLIDALHPQETRVVIADDDHIEDFDFVTESKQQIKGNIYLAKITRVEPSLQAAFVEYGGGKQGFLPFSEIHPDYYQIPVEDRQRLIEEEMEESEREDQEEEDAIEGRADRPRQQRHRGRRNRGRRGERKFRNNENGENGEHSEHAEISSNHDDNAASEDNHEHAEADDTSYAEMTQERFETSSAPLESAVEPAEERYEREEHDDEEEVAETVSEDEVEESRRRRKGASFKRYRIQEVIKRNQIVLVQVIKEERGNKGVSLTTYVSLAGRYCVLMPNSPKGGGVSRKIGNGEQRRKLKEILTEMKDSRGLAAIIRTAGIDRTKTEIKRDYEYLVKLWQDIRETTIKSTAPAVIYEESNIIKRSIRDLYTSDVERVIVQGDQAYKDAKAFMKLIMPSHAPRVKQHKESQPIFTAYGCEAQLASMYDPSAKLPSGGSIVLQQTEALISIDVNSGRSTTERNVEETAIKTNLEAAREVARQLRLRDLAGLIVIDFIDMYYGKNRRLLERAMKDALKHDRAKIQISRISAFGLMELSRQRLRPSIAESSSHICAHCQGSGFVRSVETVAIQVVRILEREAATGDYTRLRVACIASVALHLLNEKREMIRDIESRYGVQIAVEIDEELMVGQYRIMKMTEDGKETLHQEEGRNASKKRSRRGKRGGKGRFDEPNRFSDDDDEEEDDKEVEATDDSEESSDKPRHDSRRERHGQRPRRRLEEGDRTTEPAAGAEGDDDSAPRAEGGDKDDARPRRRTRGGRGRNGRRRSSSYSDAPNDGASGDAAPNEAPSGEAASGEAYAYSSPRDTERSEARIEPAAAESVTSTEVPAEVKASEPVKAVRPVRGKKDKEEPTVKATKAPKADVLAFDEASTPVEKAEKSADKPPVTKAQSEDDPSKPKRKGWWNLN